MSVQLSLTPVQREVLEHVEREASAAQAMAQMAELAKMQAYRLVLDAKNVQGALRAEIRNGELHVELPAMPPEESQ